MFATQGKDASVLQSFSTFLERKHIPKDNITEVCSDMSPAFIKGVRKEFPEAAITFDKFHVMKLVNEAVDQVRRTEQQTSPQLKRTRFLWLKNENKLNHQQVDDLAKLKDSNLKTAKAYRFKLAMQEMWTYSHLLASLHFDEWNVWAVRSRLEPIVKLAQTLRHHKEGILRWCRTRMTNGFLESINGLVQAAKRRARGYRNSNNFIAMIYATVNKLDVKVLPH